MIQKAQQGIDIMYINDPSTNRDKGNQAYIDSGLNYSGDVNKAREFVSNWLTNRKETGQYDDQLQDLDFMLNRVQNTPVLISSKYTDSGGMFRSTGRESLGGIKLYSNPSSDNFNAPSYGKNLYSNMVHELSHAASLYQASIRKTYKDAQEANEAMRSQVTAPILKVWSILGGDLVPMGSNKTENPTDIWVRLMQMRDATKMDPTRKYKYEDYKGALQRFGIDYGKEKSEALMNDVAQIDNQIDSGIYMGKNGIKIFGL